MAKDDGAARALVDAIHAGDIKTLREVLAGAFRLGGGQNEKGASGTALHAATDWPGFFPNGPDKYEPRLRVAA
jgi:uncharacterized protein